MSTLFQYLFAALDAQKGFFLTTAIGSVVRVVLLLVLIPRYNYVGPAIAFVCAEILTVGLWIFQMHKLGYPAHLASVLWRPLAGGAAMSFDHDEMGLVAKSKGILNLGIPYTLFAGEIRWATTYEAVPYPLALAGLLFGYSEWSMRVKTSGYSQKVSMTSRIAA